MRSTTIPGEARATMPDDDLLRRIAAALGISSDAFYVLPEQHVFHIAADGTQWLLASTSPGFPTVHCIPSAVDSQSPAGEGVTAFLVCNWDTSQGKALAALVDRLLTMHLHLDMRS